MTIQTLSRHWLARFDSPGYEATVCESAAAGAGTDSRCAIRCDFLRCVTSATGRHTRKRKFIKLAFFCSYECQLNARLRNDLKLRKDGLHHRIGRPGAPEACPRLRGERRAGARRFSSWSGGSESSAITFSRPPPSSSAEIMAWFAVSRWCRGKCKFVMPEWGDFQSPTHPPAVDSALQHWFILAGYTMKQGTHHFGWMETVFLSR